MRTGRKNKNAGFSMIELIVVMAIIAILAISVASGASLLTSRKVDVTVKTIASCIERARVLTLGKKENQVECIITYDSANECYQVMTFQGGSCVDTEEIDGKNVEVKVYFEGDAVAYTLDQITPCGKSGIGSASPSTGVCLQFKRDTGAFEEETNQIGGVKKSYCQYIAVSNGNRSAQIHCVSETGKISLD